MRETTISELERARAKDEACAEIMMDEETFRGFYERTARGLWAYLARITGDRGVADDLLQETFYRFLRASAKHESDAHRRNSLYRIATNLARDARRRTANQALVEGDVEVAPGPAAGTGPESHTDVTRALAQLEPRERALLWLAYAEGASHKEIAGILGLREGSMKTMLFRARRTLAGLLGDRR